MRPFVDDFVPQLLQFMEHLPTEKFGFTFSIPLIAEAKVGLSLAEMSDFERK